jgi:hypothetical protein
MRRRLSFHNWEGAVVLYVLERIIALTSEREGLFVNGWQGICIMVHSFEIVNLQKIKGREVGEKEWKERIVGSWNLETINISVRIYEELSKAVEQNEWLGNRRSSEKKTWLGRECILHGMKF